MSVQAEPRRRAEPRRTPTGDGAGPAREGLSLVVAGPPWARAAADGVAGLGVLNLWFGHTYVDEAINVCYDDTVGDLASGGLGSLLVGLALSRSSAPTSGER
jgi:hypothetical protein